MQKELEKEAQDSRVLTYQLENVKNECWLEGMNHEFSSSKTRRIIRNLSLEREENSEVQLKG